MAVLCGSPFKRCIGGTGEPVRESLPTSSRRSSWMDLSLRRRSFSFHFDWLPNRHSPSPMLTPPAISLPAPPLAALPCVVFILPRTRPTDSNLGMEQLFRRFVEAPLGFEDASCTEGQVTTYGAGRVFGGGCYIAAHCP